MPFSWEEVVTHFPKQRIAELRREICQKYKQGIPKRAIMKEYHISKNALNEILIRYKGAKRLEDYFDKSKKPKKPHRKFTKEDYDKIEKIGREEQERVERAVELWGAANKASAKPIKKEKEKRHVEMILEKAKRGIRKLAEQFNRDVDNKKAGKSISPSHFHNVLTKLRFTSKCEEIKTEGNKKGEKKEKLHRRSNPFREFQMDTAFQAIANGQIAFLVAIIDIFNSAPIVVECSVEKWNSKPSYNLVINALKTLRKKLPQGNIKIKMDHGNEFENPKVMRYCHDNGIDIIWNKKGQPWKNGFVERWFRCAKYEYLCLEFIQTKEDLHRFIRYLITHFTFDRPHQGLGNYTPAEKLDEWLHAIETLKIRDDFFKKDCDVLNRKVAVLQHLKELFQLRSRGYPSTFPPVICSSELGFLQPD